VFFSFVIDVHSRRIVGWPFASPMRTDLVLDGLEWRWTPRPGADIEVVHHSHRQPRQTGSNSDFPTGQSPHKDHT
jgi:putative transposase